MVNFELLVSCQSSNSSGITLQSSFYVQFLQWSSEEDATALNKCVFLSSILNWSLKQLSNCSTQCNPIFNIRSLDSKTSSLTSCAFLNSLNHFLKWSHKCSSVSKETEPSLNSKQGMLVPRCLAISDSLWPYWLQPARLLCPWGFSRQEYWSGLPCPQTTGCSFELNLSHLLFQSQLVRTMKLLWCEHNFWIGSYAEII